MTVYSSASKATSQQCPRCGSTLGKISRLFATKLPSRFARRRGAKII
jgi:transposase